MLVDMIGEPVVKGTRLAVDYILSLLAKGATNAEILDEHEALTEQDIQACLFFASESLQEAVCSRRGAKW